MPTLRSESLTETYRHAGDLLDELFRLYQTRAQALVLGLSGNLGAGKTTFMQGVGEYFKLKEHLTSPTFVLQKHYHIDKHEYISDLYHLDAYRLENGDELNVLGFQALLQEPRNLICLEWPENVADVLPDNLHTISFTVINDTTRDITY